MRIAYLLIAVLIFSCSPSKKENEKEIGAKAEVKTIPSITLTLISGDSLNTNTLKGKNILFFYSPDCDHCQREAKDISDHFDSFKDYSLYFICSPRPTGMITAFRKEYKLEGKRNIFFAQAEIPEVVREMGSIGTPCLFIYSEEGLLVKRVENETSAEEIIKFL